MKTHVDLSLLKKLVSTPSVYPNESKLTSFLASYLIRHGCTVTRQQVGAGRSNLFVTKGTGQTAILFYGHVDTVAAVSPTTWRIAPWKPSIDDPKLYGLGSYDMKGGIVAFIDAMIRSDSYTKALLAVDEENISEGAWLAVKEKKAFFDDVELVISAEPNFGLGLHGVTVGRTGRCVFEVVFEGKPVHIARYKEGVDAMAMLGEFIDALYKQREKLFGASGTVVQVRMVKGESTGMSVCAHATAQVEALIGYHDTISGIEQKLQRLTDGTVTLKPRKTPYLTGYYFDNFFYADMIGKIIKKHTGKTMKLVTRTSVGDDNVLATLGIPVITWGPDGGNAHAPNEFVDLQSVETLSNMFYELLAAR